MGFIVNETFVPQPNVPAKNQAPLEADTCCTVLVILCGLFQLPLCLLCNVTSPILGQYLRRSLLTKPLLRDTSDQALACPPPFSHVFVELTVKLQTSSGLLLPPAYHY